MDFIERVKLVIDEKKISQAEISRVIGQSKQNINYRLANDKFDSIDFLKAICDLGGTTFEYLIYGVEELKYIEVEKIVTSLSELEEYKSNLKNANNYIRSLEKDLDECRKKGKDTLDDVSPFTKK